MTHSGCQVPWGMETPTDYEYHFANASCTVTAIYSHVRLVWYASLNLNVTMHCRKAYEWAYTFLWRGAATSESPYFIIGNLFELLLNPSSVQGTRPWGEFQMNSVFNTSEPVWTTAEPLFNAMALGRISDVQWEGKWLHTTNKAGRLVCQQLASTMFLISIPIAWHYFCLALHAGCASKIVIRK